MKFVLWGLLWVFGLCSGLRLPRIFKDGMVLQASNGADHSVRTIWGFLDGVRSNVTLMGRCQLQNGDSFQVHDVFNPSKPEMDYEFWFDTNIVEGTKCDFTIFQDGVEDTLSLLDVMFGDVWICSGQSNMGWAMRGIFNLEEELVRLRQFPNFRFIKLAFMTNETAQDDLMMDNEEIDTWTSTALENEKQVRAFSSVCILTASYMAEVLGKNKTFGLIQSTWAGTRIEAWFRNHQACDIPDNIDESRPQNSNGYLYNAMIHPLVRSGIKGALWYQGESNVGWNRDKYQCAIKQLISDWKIPFEHYGTLVDDRMPFGIVQLSTDKADDRDPSTPMIRWHQTADYGYLPNEELPNTFLALSLDTYDEDRLHPRNKQLPSKRLACSGLNMAYGLKEWPLNGPFPEAIEFNKFGNEIQVDILMDQDFTWNGNETNGFSYCCCPDLSACNEQPDQWQPVVSLNFDGRALAMKIPSCSIGLAYLWKTTPVIGNVLPMYAANEFGLPAAPWMRQIN